MTDDKKFPDPLFSVALWCEAVGHGPKQYGTYLRLTLEEMSEMVDEATASTTNATIALGSLQKSLDAQHPMLKLIEKGLKPGELDKALDAALDTAWTALCNAYIICGSHERLIEAWTTLHHSNITDKQVDGKFVKDETGKVKKPDGWEPPDFKLFVDPQFFDRLS